MNECPGAVAATLPAHYAKEGVGNYLGKGGRRAMALVGKASPRPKHEPAPCAPAKSRETKVSASK